MSKEQKGFIVYGDVGAVVNELTDEQTGQLFKGMVGYFAEGKPPKFDGVLKYVWIPIKQQMDRDSEKYAEKCEKNRKKIQDYWNKVKGNTTEYHSIPMYTNATNTKTDTDTNTDTNTDTTTTTDTKAAFGRRGGGPDDDKFDLWKKLTPKDIDVIYDVYPESGGFLIDAVYEEVKAKRKEVKDAAAYILGYAKNVGWDDSAEH